MNILFETEKVLKENNKYISDDGKLLKAVVYTDIMNNDNDLLSLLLSNTSIKKTFFNEIDGVLVFDKQKFAWFIESKEFLPDSYTSYTNKIGLVTDKKFISKINDVVLDFPYKDCVLEGGQDKDNQKRNEIFYHEIISVEHVNRMLEPKIFTNARRYSKNRIDDNILLNDNDNLIIKGNNLIALSCLLKKYEGKVKCIYIDPPYNTKTDSFKYNDSFNHSTWLTFMKNRLDLSKKLLSNEGVIFVQCDDNEQAYLKILMNDIFGVENTDVIIWNKEGEGKSGTLKQVKRFRCTHEYIVVGYVDKSNTSFNKISSPIIGRENELNTANLAVNEDNVKVGHANWMEIISPTGKKWYKHWKFNNETIKQYLKDNLIYFGKDGNNQPRLIIPMDHRRKVYLESILNKGSTTQGRSELEELFNDKVFDTPKPESLIKLIIEASTGTNDLVLDFNLGSGTTTAVAHKLNRKYIGIEQMDYIENVAVKRMQKVISGEQGGISKDVNWSGGGSFVYFELLEDAQKLIKQIKEADETTINTIKDKIYADKNIIPYIQTLDLLKVDEDFKKLNLTDKKNALCLLINKNKLYVNYSDINDEEYKINDNDKNFTNSFYGR